LGYRDELITVAEPYRLFAIEADSETAARLRFAGADPAIIMSEDIAPYRMRKVRLLNGAHTIMVPLALLSGCATVADAVNDPRVGAFLRHVLLQELVASVEADGAAVFAHHVLERFANPFIRHELIDITLQQTAKMRVRVVPSILDYARKFGSAPRFVAFGFAAWLLYMRDGRAARPDAHAEQVRDWWRRHPTPEAVALAAASDEQLWEHDLAEVPGFTAAVAEVLESLLNEGIDATLDAQLASAGAAV
jgi:tagaturonate reductase